jgi:phage repressor protein C with HTH and peptisase S24 domain
MAKTTRGERLRLARKRVFGSGREAAEALGIPQQTYNSHERAGLPGSRDFGADEAEVYGRRFGVRPEWLLTGRGHAPLAPDDVDEEPAASRTPIVGYVGAGATAHYYNIGQGHLDDTDRPSNATDNTVAVEIRGDSLGPYFDRWLVFYDNVRSPITDDMYGKLCVVGLANDQVLVKEVRPGSRKGLFNLGPAGAESTKDAKVLWGARVRMIAPR